MDILMFAQGQIATLTAMFVTSPAGMPVDVPDATIQVVGPGGSTILPPTPMVHVFTGFYFYDWAIPNSLPVDTYTVVITGTVLGTPTAMNAYLRVVPAGVHTPASCSQRIAELICGLDSYVGQAQRIPVYNELARRGADRQTFSLTWPRWNLGNHIVKLNNEIITTGYTLNLDTGTITFTTPLHDTDKVYASYNWRFFTQIDQMRFLSDALNQINLEAPGTNFMLNTVPDIQATVMLMGAARNALQQLTYTMAWQEAGTIFGGGDKTEKAISTFQTQMESYEKRFEKEKRQVKRMLYPKTASAVSPEFTLPGGRCFFPTTKMVFTFEEEATQASIEDAWKYFMEGKKISVLSDSGTPAFAPVSHIWKSGMKRVWKLQANSGLSVSCSSEHLFFCNGKYIPIKEVRQGDEILTCIDGKNIHADHVKSIQETNEEIEMYDLEVPSTGNLFANGIKCHNSRWFRYLFSSNIG